VADFNQWWSSLSEFDRDLFLRHVDSSPLPVEVMHRALSTARRTAPDVWPRNERRLGFGFPAGMQQFLREKAAEQPSRPRQQPSPPRREANSRQPLHLQKQDVVGISLLVVMVVMSGLAGIRILTAPDTPTPRGSQAATGPAPEPTLPSPMPATELSPTRLPPGPPRPATSTSRRSTEPQASAATDWIRRDVHPGSFCTTQDARGVTVRGKPMVCTTTEADERKRWRAA
jgi:hypothetical protein